jgi:hypothetical protein
MVVPLVVLFCSTGSVWNKSSDVDRFILFSTVWIMSPFFQLGKRNPKIFSGACQVLSAEGNEQRFLDNFGEMEGWST